MFQTDRNLSNDSQMTRKWLNHSAVLFYAYIFIECFYHLQHIEKMQRDAQAHNELHREKKKEQTEAVGDLRLQCFHIFELQVIC